MNRRTFLKGMAVAASGLILPQHLVSDAEEVHRRIWALGGLPDTIVLEPPVWRGVYQLEPWWAKPGNTIHLFDYRRDPVRERDGNLYADVTGTFVKVLRVNDDGSYVVDRRAKPTRDAIGIGTAAWKLRGHDWGDDQIDLVAPSRSGLSVWKLRESEHGEEM